MRLEVAWFHGKSLSVPPPGLATRRRTILDGLYTDKLAAEGASQVHGRLYMPNVGGDGTCASALALED